MKEEITFEVGDKVEWAGMIGEVKTHIKGFQDYIEVLFSNNICVNFKPDGRFYSWHKEPSLKLISKAKKKTKWYAYLIYNYGNTIGTIEFKLVDDYAYPRLPHLDMEIEE